MRVRSFALALLLVASAAGARIISYSPYSDRISYPATQHRMNRFFAIVEVVPVSQVGLSPVFFSYPTGQLVLYDSMGENEPRVIFPLDSTPTAFSTVAVREDNGVSTILIQTNANFNGQNSQRNYIWLMSTDSGATWKNVTLPQTYVVQNLARFQNDVGGSFVNARFSPVRIGTKSVPFIVQSAASISSAASWMRAVISWTGKRVQPRISSAARSTGRLSARSARVAST